MYASHGKTLIAVELRRLVNDRAGGYCEYCKFPVKFALESMEIDHAFPISLGGKTVDNNLVFVCHGCNQHKQNRIEGMDLVSSSLAKIYHPRKMVWGKHFSWSQDTTLIVGKTATGRVKVQILKLNRSGLVNLRQVLERSGDHPPN